MGVVGTALKTVPDNVEKQVIEGAIDVVTEMVSDKAEDDILNK